MPSPNTNSVFTTLARLHRIAHVLRSGRPVTISALARREEVSRKTITRSIQFLHGSLGWEIESTPKGYRLRAQGLPLLTVNR